MAFPRSSRRDRRRVGMLSSGAAGVVSRRRLSRIQRWMRRSSSLPIRRNVSSLQGLEQIAPNGPSMANCCPGWNAG